MSSGYPQALPALSQTGYESRPVREISRHPPKSLLEAPSHRWASDSTCQNTSSDTILPSTTTRNLLRIVCLLAALLASFYWCRRIGSQGFKDLTQAADTLTQKLLLPPELHSLHFIPANNPDIRYIGRWTQTPNRLRRDSHFTGAYLEFTVRNCSSVYISLHNSDSLNQAAEFALLASDGSEHGLVGFHPLSRESASSLVAPPVSLLAQIDGSRKQSFFRFGQGIIAIAAADMTANEDHTIRIKTIDVGIDSAGQAIIEFEGIWMNDGGSIVPPEQQRRPRGSDAASAKQPPSLNASTDSSEPELHLKTFPNAEQIQLGNAKVPTLPSRREKTLEIVSDMSGTMPDRGDVASFEGWEDAIGKMYGCDHVHIALHAMCLATPYIGGRARPSSIEDAFFRSGPPGTSSFAKSWNFHTYIPDVMILTLGSSDEHSFRHHVDQYDKTRKELDRIFEDTYIRFVQAIRRAAYPLHPAALNDYSSNADGFVFNSAPATIPIFVVSPFTGEMGHSTAKVVEKLQAEGDKSVYWLDTSGWFSSHDFESAPKKGSDRTIRHLNAGGNRKAAVFLQSHLCHHLADNQTQCAFLKHEAYTGKAYVPSEAHMGKAMEEAKIERLRSALSPGNVASRLLELGRVEKSGR